MATVAATLVVGLVAGCSSHDTIACTATLGEASSKVTFDIKDGTKSVATLNSYSVVFEVTDGGNGLQADLRNPDQSSISTVKTNTNASSGSAGTPDGVLAFQCGR